MLDLKSLANDIQDKIDEVINPIFAKANGVALKKELNKEDRMELENLKLSILCFAQQPEDIKENIIGSMLKTEAPLEIEKCVRSVLSDRIEKYKKDHGGNSPSEKVKKEMKSSAWAICRSNYSKRNKGEVMID